MEVSPVQGTREIKGGAQILSANHKWSWTLRAEVLLIYEWLCRIVLQLQKHAETTATQLLFPKDLEK